MKKVELKVLSELMKNSKISDRELAKTIGVSQPTVTRARTRLEKNGYIQEYQQYLILLNLDMTFWQ